MKEDPGEWLRNLGAGSEYGEPVGIPEIADRLGVSVNTVHSWRQRSRKGGAPGFPEPDGAVSNGECPYWWWETVEAWAEETGRI